MPVLTNRAIQIAIVPILYTIGWASASAQERWENTITYESPTKTFTSLLLQTHKEKLRFGNQDNYWIKPDGTAVDQESSDFMIMDKRTQMVKHGQQGIVELLKMKFMKDTYKDIDQNLFTKYASSMYKEEKNSYLAQEHLLRLANAVTCIDGMYHYFCNPKSEDCTIKVHDHDYNYRTSYHIKPWGGHGANEFQKLKSYTSYAAENLEVLQNWSSSFFPGNSVQGYFVTTVFLDTYDFENKGYWLRSRSFRDNGFLVRYRDLEPVNANQRKLLHPQGIEILYQIPSDEAEKFSGLYKNIYLVFDISLTIKGRHRNNSNTLNVAYQLNSQAIELYVDDSLTHKIGEILIDDMITTTK
ncbi:MAG: hypothetical protein AAGB24_16430 [Bacteroidota bacterium]